MHVFTACELSDVASPHPCLLEVASPLPPAMSVRPLPRKRRLVVDSSDDEQLSSTICKSSRIHSDPLNKSTSATARPTSLSSSLASAHLTIPAPVTRRPKAKATVSKSKQLVLRPGKTGLVNEQPIQSVTSASQRVPSSSQSKPPAASQNEDLDDLIVDSLSDDEVLGPCDTIAAPTKFLRNPNSQTTTRKYNATRTRLPRTESAHTLKFSTQRENGSGVAKYHLELRGPDLQVPPKATTAKTVGTRALARAVSRNTSANCCVQ